MLMIPCRVWFRPLTRVRCFSGTRRPVEDAMAGPWNAPPSKRIIRMMNTCHSWTVPAMNSSISTPVARATAESATIMMIRRLRRSMSGPMNGPSRIWGSIATRVAVASIVADPVFWVIHHTSANCTSDEPRSDNACPLQIKKNFGAQLFAAASFVVLMSILLNYVS